MFITKKFNEKNKVTFLKFFPNAMIKNIKIHNIFDIIAISKYMEPNIYIFIYLKMFVEMFLMIFQSLMGLGKSRCDIPSGTTQGQDYPF